MLDANRSIIYNAVAYKYHDLGTSIEIIIMNLDVFGRKYSARLDEHLRKMRNTKQK